MTAPPPKYVAPTVGETAYNCPHCGALAKQQWYRICAEELGQHEIPAIWTDTDVEKFEADELEDEQEQKRLKDILERMSKGVPFLDDDRSSVGYALRNVYCSQCFNCQESALWIYNRLLYPITSNAPPPNADLPPEIRNDYREAASILDLSPRGAAAILRLCIQKLCRELGGQGINLNADIAQFVTKGMDPRVRQALDVVRVIGNHAVHPGLIDLRDDRATAEKLFALVNLIADIMLSQPKHLQDLFDGLPESAREAIARRDTRATRAKNR